MHRLQLNLNRLDPNRSMETKFEVSRSVKMKDDVQTVSELVERMWTKNRRILYFRPIPYKKSTTILLTFSRSLLHVPENSGPESYSSVSESMCTVSGFNLNTNSGINALPFCLRRVLLRCPSRTYDPLYFFI